jgi:hypothetical protein
MRAICDIPFFGKQNGRFLEEEKEEKGKEAFSTVSKISHISHLAHAASLSPPSHLIFRIIPHSMIKNIQRGTTYNSNREPQNKKIS